MNWARSLWVGAAAALPLGAAPAQQVAFTSQVLPVLEQKCFECHREAWQDDTGKLRKPKGGLRLDGRAWIEKGGTGGRVLVPGKPDQSELYTRTVLPEDHDERMPEEGDMLTAAEASALKEWIAQGASFGDWTGAAGPAATATETSAVAAAPSQRLAWLDEVGKGLSLPAPSVLAKAAAGKARIEPIGDSGLLRVEFAGHEAEVDDAALAALAPIQQQIAVLVLARTRITDAGCKRIAAMPCLVQLDLRETKVGDSGIATLTGLTELRVLNLFATEVGDGAVASLGKLRKLEELQVWQSGITEDGISRLREALPAARIAGAPALPPPAPPAQAGPRRRR